MLDKGIVDITCSLVQGKNLSRGALFYSTGTSYSAVAHKDDDRFSLTIHGDDGMTVVSSPSVFQESKFRALQRNYDFSVRTKLCITPEAALSELQHGNADLALVSSITATQDFTVVSQFGMHNFFIGVTKNKPALMSEMDATIEQIITEPDYEQTISRHSWPVPRRRCSYKKRKSNSLQSRPRYGILKADTPVISLCANGEFLGMAKIFLTTFRTQQS